MYEKEMVIYILKKLGGLHPFYISRLIALVDLKYLEETGEKITSLDYKKFPGAFVSEKLMDVIKSLPVEKVRDQGGGKLVITEEVEISLPKNVKSILDKIITQSKGMSSTELNNFVISSRYYDRL